MANPEHLSKIREGVEAWNAWRDANLEVGSIDLSDANLNRADLSGANLCGADLSGADLSGAVLIGVGLIVADLSGANLSGANLSQAVLNEANLSGTDLKGAYLEYAHFHEANLNGANLSGANLSGAVLTEANLSGADLTDAILEDAHLDWQALSSEQKRSWRGKLRDGSFIAEKDLLAVCKDHERWFESGKKEGQPANLSLTRLRGANLSGKNLSEANLSGANLSQAILNEANLSGADLKGAYLEYTFFHKANLSGANLSRANLSGVDLRRANLNGANLNGANLNGANLNGANLSGVDLRRANLIGAHLSEANLSGANLSGANLTEVYLSGAVLDENTDYKQIRGIGVYVGVNGFWSEFTDSAALMTLTPPANSMLGSNPEAVIESLKRARRLHGSSMSMVGIVLLIIVLRLDQIKFPYFDAPVTPDRFGLLAMPISVGFLSLATSFMADALKGTRYLNDRQSAMTIGNFPWVLSKFAGGGWFNKLQSFITRSVMSFHPIVYIYFLHKWLQHPQITNILIFNICIILLLMLAGWTLIVSQRFQRPILFDKKTEEERLDNLTKLTEAVEAQTEVIEDLVDLIKLKQDNTSEDKERKKDSSPS